MTSIGAPEATASTKVFARLVKLPTTTCLTRAAAPPV
jgi:hypothetical protein